MQGVQRRVTTRFRSINPTHQAVSGHLGVCFAYRNARRTWLREGSVDFVADNGAQYDKALKAVLVQRNERNGHRDVNYLSNLPLLRRCVRTMCILAWGLEE